ncbi:alpha/beta hydrolase [Bacillus sp. 37MA]|uniref:alpha/beta hydrolase n=1 Tax=Bacillus sp. 37MA TaxID=1132442 RepID=UPI00037E1BDE|nr:alpha/beta hydrolase [Bacillus sp. 37MA]
MPFLQCKHDRLFYMIESSGGEEKETMVMIHTNVTDHTLFDEVVPFLKEQYNVLRYDLRGLGQSDGGDALFTYEQYVSDLRFLIRELDLTSVHLVGFGLGALIAARFTALYGEWVQKVVLIAMPCNPPHLIEKVRKHRREISRFGTVVPVDYIIDMSTVLPKEDARVVKLRETISKTPVSTYARLMDLSVSATPLTDLRQIQKPVLTLSGDKDLVFPPHFLEASTMYLPNFRHMRIAHSSTFTVIDQPEVTAQLILHFLQESQVEKEVLDDFLTSMYEDVRLYTKQVYDIGIGKVDERYHNEIHIDFLSSFHVQINGKVVMNGWNKRFAKQLFLYLVFHPSTTREAICDVMWPDMPIQQSRKNLRVYLSYLKSLIQIDNNKEPILLMDREHVYVKAHISGDWIKLNEALQLALHESDHLKRFEACKKVLDLVQNVLPIRPVLYDDWFLEVHDRVELQITDIILWMADWLFEHEAAAAIEHIQTYLPLIQDEFALRDKLEEFQIRSAHEKSMKE